MNRIRRIFEQRILHDFTPLLSKKCICLPTCSSYTLIENKHQIKSLHNVPVDNMRCFTMSQNNNLNLRNHVEISVKHISEKNNFENMNSIVKSVVEKHSMNTKYADNDFEKEDGVIQSQLTHDVMEKQKHVIDLFEDYIKQCDSLKVLGYYENVIKTLKWPDQYLLSDVPVDLPVTEEEEKRQNLERSRYVFKGDQFPVVTSKFYSSKEMLTSLGLDTAELKYYPRVQLMTQAEVERAVECLHQEGFQVIFSLHLIDCIHRDIKAIENRDAQSLCSDSYVPGSLRFLSKNQNVKNYFKLCKELEKPDLDPRLLIDEMIKLHPTATRCNWFVHILSRVQQLKYIGASSADIWSNIDVLDKSLTRATFNAKVQIYESLFNGALPGPFPIERFKKQSLKEFCKNVCMGGQVDKICSLLNITYCDYLEILSYATKTKKLQASKDPLYCMEGKIILALQAGISQDDILDNFNKIVMLPVDTYYNTIMTIKQYGGIGSISVLDSIIKNQPDQTVAAELGLEEDWLSLSEPTSDSDNAIPAEVQKWKSSRSEKRTQIYSLITKKLNLDTNQRNRLVSKKLNLDDVTPFEVKKNIERLLRHGFSNEDITSCPLILTHSTISLQQGIKSLTLMLRKEAQKLTSNKDIESEEINVMNKNEQETLRVMIQSNPQKRIHVLQYFLEKESNLSASVQSARAVLKPHIDL